MTTQIQKNIAQAISKDFTIEQINNFSIEEKTKITIAYMDAELKKIEKIQSKYLTNPLFKADFKDLVLGLM